MRGAVNRFDAKKSTKAGAATNACTTLLAFQLIFAPYAEIKPVLQTFENWNEAKWTEWRDQENQKIRARLDQGDLDSAVNFLFFGTSFTKQPRIPIEDLAEASRNGVLRLRVIDLLRGLRTPNGNERLIFLRNFIVAKGMDPDTTEGGRKIGVYILENVERVLKELRDFAERVDNEKTGDPGTEFNARSRLFRDRGVSLDTSILPNFAIEETLRDLRDHGILPAESVERIAVIGPGLDFADWDRGYDYYPQRSPQPFALQDSLARLGMARNGKAGVTVLDISPRVLDHFRQARARAKQGSGYTIQLPRDPAREWLPAMLSYWQRFGDRIGSASTPMRPPEMLRTLETRAVLIEPAAVLQCEPQDLNIVLQRLEIPPAERFDLVIATNVFVYYDVLEQALALRNVAAMLKPGGLLLVNNKLPELPETAMRQIGATAVRYATGSRIGDSMLWYRRE